MNSTIVAPFQPPANQRHIVLSCQLGYNMIRARQVAKVTSGIGGGMTSSTVTLFVPGQPEDWNIYVGDLLYSEKHHRLPLGGEGNTQSQQPWVIAGLNNIQAEKEDLNAQPGFTLHEKKRAHFRKRYMVAGPSLKNHPYNAKDQSSLDDPVALTGGTFHIYNNGPVDILPFEYLCWDLPDDSKPMPADKSGLSTVTANTRKLIYVPLRHAFRPINAENMFRFTREVRPSIPKIIFERDVNEAKKVHTQLKDSNEKNVLNCIGTIMYLWAKIGTLENRNQLLELERGGLETVEKTIESNGTLSETVGRLATALTGSEVMREAFQKLIEAIGEPEREARERIVAKSTRGGKVGERLDILRV